MEKNTGKVREKSGNFVSPEKWEPCEGNFLLSRYKFRNAKRVGLQELGPRFTMKLRSLQKGTFDSKYGEYEWVHKVNCFATVC